MKKNLFLLSAICLGISACSSIQNKQNQDIVPQKIVDQQIVEGIQKIQRAQATLYNSSALNNERMKIPLWIDGNQKITVSWYGDAEIFFKELAKAKNKQVVTSGIKEPLPIAINVVDTEYSTIISLLKDQLGYRANVIENENTITLIYNNK